MYNKCLLFNASLNFEKEPNHLGLNLLLKQKVFKTLAEVNNHR